MKANPKKELFRIELIVGENCQEMRIKTTDKMPSYQEIIGALDVQKMACFVSQTENNIKEWIKEKERLNKLQKKLNKNHTKPQ